MTGDLEQVVEHLLSKYEAISTTKNDFKNDQ
jgi:hypothetical protein